MFRKPLSQLTGEDISWLCKEQVRESDIVEFKQGLPAKGGLDAWHAGSDKIGEFARDRIVHEIIAFANAHGGTLVLGIEESSDKPARASAVKPIPRCADLAGRLSQALAEVAEPPLAPFPAVVPVATHGDAGVVVFQITASLNAPHRHRTTLKSHVRRGEQAVPLTMREVQDLTMRVERGLILLDRMYSESAQRFSERVRSSHGLALRATAAPLSPLSLPLPSETSINPRFQWFDGQKGDRSFSIGIPRPPVNFRPILRGIRAEETDATASVSAEIRSSGFLEIFFYVADRHHLAFPATWYGGIACNALSFLDLLRNAAGSPGTEYGLELAAYSVNHLDVHEFGGREFSFDDRWPGGGITFPRYHVGPRASFGSVMKLVDADFWNALGRRVEQPLQVEF